MKPNHPQKTHWFTPQDPLWVILFLRLEGTHLGTQYGVFYSGHDTLMCLSQDEDLLRQLSKPFLNRDVGNCTIGSVLSPHDVRLMKTFKLWNKEGSSLLLLRYSVL